MPNLRMNLQNLSVGEELAPERVVPRRSNREQAPFLQIRFIYPALLIKTESEPTYISSCPDWWISLRSRRFPLNGNMFP
jgi:hypothetical protein